MHIIHVLGTACWEENPLKKCDGGSLIRGLAQNLCQWSKPEKMIQALSRINPGWNGISSKTVTLTVACTAWQHLLTHETQTLPFILIKFAIQLGLDLLFEHNHMDDYVIVKTLCFENNEGATLPAWSTSWQGLSIDIMIVPEISVNGLTRDKGGGTRWSLLFSWPSSLWTPKTAWTAALLEHLFS